MNIVINRAAFSRAVALVASVVPNKPTIPMVGMVRVVANTEGLITVTGTDLSCSITARVEARVDDGGGVAIAKGDLMATLSAMPEGDVAVEVVDGKRIAFRSGKRRIAIPCVSAADFPHVREWPDAREMHVKAEALARVLAASEHARSEDITRPIGCTRIELPGGVLRAVTTDGHQIAAAEEKVADLPSEPHLAMPHGVIAPLRAMLDTDDEDTVAIARHEAVIGVRRGSTSMVFTEGMPGFPSWENVLKLKSPGRAVVARAELAAAIKAVQVAADRGKDASHRVSLNLDAGRIAISACNPQDARGDDEVTCTVEGATALIHMNAIYIVQTLAVITTPDVVIAFSNDGPHEPVFFRPTEGADVFVVMPQRV